MRINEFKEKKILLIINPVAGQGRGKKYAAEIFDILSRRGGIVTLYMTHASKTENKQFLLKNISCYDAIVCCGGDGTLSDTMSAIIEAKSQIPLGFIPVGTTNDFAKTLGIPSTPSKAALNISKWKKKKIDCGLFNGNVFSYIAATGIFAEASYSATLFEKNFFGHFAYILRGIESLGHLKAFHMKVKADNKILENDYIYASVSNTTSLGGVFKLDPQKVKINDGLFELVLIKRPKNFSDFKDLILGTVSKGLNSEYVDLIYAKNIQIYSKTKLNFSLDGENGGAHNKIIIKNLPQRITMLGIK